MRVFFVFILGILTLIISACHGTASPIISSAPSPTVKLTAIFYPTPQALASPISIPNGLPTDPPPTPIPTLTPIAYTVESGDTLLGIAIDYGVSLEDIQSANPGIRAETLQIGQIVLVPQESGINSNQEFSETAQVDIAGIGLYESPVGGIWLMGEIVNPNSLPIENVQIAVTLYQDKDQPGENQNARIGGDYIPPGGTAPFAAYFANLSQSIDRVQYRVIPFGAIFVDNPDYWIDGFAVESEGQQTTSGVYEVSGRIINQSGQLVDQLCMRVTLYDKKQVVTGYREVCPLDPLENDQGTQFAIKLSPAGPDTTNHKIFAIGRHHR